MLTEFMGPIKQQVEYTRINREYNFVKRRSLVNYLTNEKINLEQHFHQRALQMLKAIQKYENQNLQGHIKDLISKSYTTVVQDLQGPSKQEILDGAFEAALVGIRSGVMEYKQDPLLPRLQNEIQRRINEFQNLTPEQESRLLALSPEQRRYVADQDRKTKGDYLAQVPNINSPGIKTHPKYKNFVDMINNLHKSEVKA